MPSIIGRSVGRGNQWTFDGEWYNFFPSSDSRVVYVSQTGTANGTGSLASPISDIPTAIALIRSGFPDFLLFKRGETWVDTVLTGPIASNRDGTWRVEGRSAQEPIVVGSYSTNTASITASNPLGDHTGARTKFTKTKDGLFLNTSANFAQMNANGGRHVVFTGLHFYCEFLDADAPGSSIMNITGDLKGPQTISAASDIGGGVTQLTVGSTAQMTTGQSWVISGITGATNATELNGTWPITVVDGTHVNVPVQLTHAYSSGGSIGSNQLWNVTIPAQLKTGYWVIGSGIDARSVTAFSAINNTITFSGAASLYSATSVPFQCQMNGSNGGASLSVLNPGFGVCQDCYFEFAAFGLGSYIGNSIAQGFIEQKHIHRCIFDRCYVPFSGGGIFTSSNVARTTQGPMPGYLRVWECSFYETGFSRHQNNWTGPGNTRTHNMYTHDPSVPFDFKNILNLWPSSTGIQNREGGEVQQVLFGSCSTASTTNPENWPSSIHDCVVAGGEDIWIGIRIATQDSPVGTSIIYADGVVNTVNPSMLGSNFHNLDNPNCIAPGTGLVIRADCRSYENRVGGTSAGALSNVLAGKRGDGIKAGDRLLWIAGRCYGFTIGPPGQVYLLPGTSTDGVSYPVGSTVQVTAGGAEITVIEPSGASTRPANEPFKFTSGTLPPELSLNTEYWSLDAGTTYRIATTMGGTPIVGTGTTKTGCVRTGSRQFRFPKAGGPYTANQYWPGPYDGVPPFVTVGMQVGEVGQARWMAFGNVQGTTVSYISSDRSFLITADPAVLSVQGRDQDRFGFDMPNPTYNQTCRVGPNNIFINGRARGNNTSGALAIDVGTCQADMSGNYIINWDYVSNLNNIQDQNVTNGLTAYTATNNKSQTLDNVINSDAYLQACPEAYDSSLRGTAFTATFATNGFNGLIMTVTSGTAPLVGDYIFPSNFSASWGIRNQTYVVKSTGVNTFLVVSRYNNYTTAPNGGSAITCVSGSMEHLWELAKTQTRTNWNPAYTAKACINYIRTVLGLATL